MPFLILCYFLSFLYQLIILCIFPFFHYLFSVLFHRKRKIKSKTQKSISTFYLGCCVYVSLLLSLFFICLSFSCVFRTVAVLGLLMLLMFITTFLNFSFLNYSSYIGKNTLIKIPHLYCPFHLLCH